MEAEEISLEKSYDDGKIDGKLEIAKKLLAKGKNAEEVAELTSLTLEQIEELK